MVRADVLTKLLAAVRHRIERVEGLRQPSAAALEANEDALDLVAFNLMLAVQAACDAAAHIIADEGLAPASSLAEGFARLEEHGVLSHATRVALARAVGLRNVVAHAYHRLDTQAVQEASTTGLSDLDAFVREVAAWVSSRDG